MKQIILIFMLLVFPPSIALGSNAAPYTEDAWQKIVEATNATPKEEYEQKLSESGFHKGLVEYYSVVFEKAGYNFIDTINKIIQDMKNNPDVIPTERQSVYNNVYILLTIMMYECNFEKDDCLQFFPEESRESLQWFIENSEYGKRGNSIHHGMKK